MEEIMKKVLTIAIVAMLATATLFAGVSFSGRFRQGYTFTFEEDKDPVVTAWKSEEAKLIMKFSDDNGLWTVNFKTVGKKFDSNDQFGANATFNLTKALSLAGIDTGDFSLAISLGNNDKMTALTAYDDPTGDEYYKLKNYGKESMQLAMAYGNLAKFNVAFDPTTDGGSTVLSAKVTPVEGIDVAAAYAYQGWIEDAVLADNGDIVVFEYEGVTEVVADNVIGLSAKADIAKLAGLDFALSVSAYDNIFLGIKYISDGDHVVDVDVLGVDDAAINSFAANIAGGIDMVDAFVEFRMLNVKDDDSYYGLKTQVNLNVVENLALDAYYNIANLEEAGDTFSIGADASYSFAGVEFALNAEYKKATKSFSLTPKMIIVF